MKRVLTIQDISCLGKCSLTVALPVISAYGIETCIIPTAVLSTHTMFSDFTFRDLTPDLIPIKNHYEKEGFKFDAVYSGYLGSLEQIDIVKEYFKAFKQNGNVTVVDPAMADNGKLYKCFDINFAHYMLTLCSVADIILPNLTEACFMLDEEYIESGYTREYIQNVLKRLCGCGCKIAVITGVSFDSGKIGVMGYDSVRNKFFEYYHKKVNAFYHGTGDIFSSCTVGGIVKGLSIEKSLEIAADFTADCIETTKNDVDGVDYGVEFEFVLPKLIKRLEEIK